MNTAAPAPILIAHRGASGRMPEHTLGAYALAILQGADFIEPDLVATRDGVLVARHENEIAGTTDVAAHPEFAARRRTQSVDGVAVTGWFTEDFTLAELKSLRARERIPLLRPGNTTYDGKLEVPTLQEILAYLDKVNTVRQQAGQKAVGIYPETKHPSHFRALGLALEPPLLQALRDGLGAAPVFIQCFEVGNLRQLRKDCDYPLVQLMSAAGGPWDLQQSTTSYQDMVSPGGLRGIAEYADAIGVEKTMVLAPAGDGALLATGLVANAHAAGLAVHVWTFRAENHFLPSLFRQGDNPAAHGDLAAEIGAYLTAGVDGLFSDFPGLASTAMQRFAAGAGMVDRST